MNHHKYLKNFIKNTKAFVNKKVISKGYPPIIALEPTNCCRMKCIMCPRRNMKRPLGIMDFDLFKKIINQTQDYTNMISLELFGDALLHPKIKQMVDYIHQKGMLTQISTNPMSLTDKAINQILNSKLNVLLLSLDGIDNQTYKKYRGDFADYNQATSQINKLLKKKIELKKKKPFIDIRMIGLPGLKKYFKIYKKQWNKKGISEVSMSNFHTFGGSVKSIDGADSKDSKWNYQGICYKPWQGIHIMWDGRVVPCCFDYDGKYIIGDLKKESLKEIWNNNQMKKLRKQCLTKNFKSNPLCAACTEMKPAKVSKYFPFDTFFLKHIIDYNYQRNQNRKIVKILKKIVYKNNKMKAIHLK